MNGLRSPSSVAFSNMAVSDAWSCSACATAEADHVTALLPLALPPPPPRKLNSVFCGCGWCFSHRPDVCIFAYGQTGSGKTFTMQGQGDQILNKKGEYNQELAGIAPRAAEEIYRIAERDKAKFRIKTKFTQLELYRDGLCDLGCDPKQQGKAKLTIKKDARGIVYVDGQTIQEADDAVSLLRLLDKGIANRHTASTKMNSESSRSHLVSAIIIENTNLKTNVTSCGKLTLVDLAGSERVGKTGATGDTMKEAMAINKSLSALGDVVNALTTGAKHVPYRNHKLTTLMSDSIGGNAKTLMFVNLSPADYNAEESHSSLLYAERVKKVKNSSAKTVETAEIKALKDQLAKLKKLQGGKKKKG